MALDTNGSMNRQSAAGYRPNSGWTSLHSWIFLVIAALGLLLLIMENRYAYLAPHGNGKAYRVDRLFGSIQEFSPPAGWVSAELGPGRPVHASDMMEPPPAVSRPMPADSRGPNVVKEEQSDEEESKARQDVKPAGKESKAPEQADEEPVSSTTSSKDSRQPVPTVPPVIKRTGLSKEDKYQAFVKTFPDYGEEEFQLANDDLFPDWRRKLAPSGEWQEFLSVYKEFIDWWIESGSPPEPGMKLWSDFIAKKKEGN
ncbi:MAG: hypothetical protein V2B18_20575 [Pseudomonadota bacterium]